MALVKIEVRNYALDPEDFTNVKMVRTVKLLGLTIKRTIAYRHVPIDSSL
jgi:hypothetical protein